jgi:hypothetical protein
MSSLCFAEAAAKRKSDEITEDEYLQAIVNHCTGLRHGKNRLCNDDAVIDDNYNYAFARNIQGDKFASAMAYWIIRNFYYRQTQGKAPLSWIWHADIRIDTTVLHKTLKAYRANDVASFKSALHELKKDLQPGLCESLACLAILVPDPKMLEVILEVHGKNDIRFNFHAAFDSLKHDKAASDPIAAEAVRVVEKSEFKSMVPEGKRFKDLHPLDYLA